jgi:hypothetical protein
MIKFKNKQVEERSKLINKKLFSICVEMGWHCASHSVDFVLTETLTTKEEDDAIGRVSSTHREGRAVDVRTKGWSDAFLMSFVSDFNKKYGHLGAISLADGMRKFIIDKSKTNQPHLHIQIGRKFTEET